MAVTKRIHVLSIDGGGIRGIIPARILADLRRRVGRDLHEVFDLISGTSTGGIIALGIGTRANSGLPYAPYQVLALYAEYGRNIFLNRYSAEPRHCLVRNTRLLRWKQCFNDFSPERC